MFGNGDRHMDKLEIVMYHYVREIKNSRYANIKGLEYNQFKEQIQYFSKYYHVITMEQLISYYQNGEKLPENALLLTFDDGYLDAYTYVLPVLKENHMQGSFFVPGKVFMEHSLLDVNKIHYLLASVPIEQICIELKSQLEMYRGKDWSYPSIEELWKQYAIANRFDNKETIFVKRILQVALPEDLRKLICNNLFCEYMDVSEETLACELYLNYDQMKEMKREGMFFGIHGYDHYWMNQLSKEKLSADIDHALNCMEGLVDRNAWVINYPYGSYSENVISVCKEKGSILGLSTDVRVADLDNDDRYKLPRMDTNDYLSIDK